jgi:hypothetical protein
MPFVFFWIINKVVPSLRRDAEGSQIMENLVAELEARLAAIEKRLSALESTRPVAPSFDEEAPALVPSVPVPSPSDGFLSNAPTLIGRVLLIFGGAYLLRAITEFQVVPKAIGILLGATYALGWLFMAYRKAGDENQRVYALFYGGASIFLALPLLVEATTRFELLSGLQAVVALTFFCAMSLWVAVSRNLQSLGWLVTAGGIVSALVVLKVSHSAVPVAVFLIFLGLGSLWAVHVRQWMGLQWLGAIGADVCVSVLARASSSDQWSVDPLTPLLLGTILLVTYLISFALRSHVRGKDVGIFEAVQGVLAVSIAFLTAVVASRAGRVDLALVGTCSLVLGTGAYALAFTPETRSVRGRNFYFFSTLGLGLVVAGSALLMSPVIAATVWSLMALAFAWFSGRYDRVTLSLQCTFLLFAAGVSSGILETGFLALVGDASASWPPLVPWHPIVALATVACLFIPVAQKSDRWGYLAGLPQLILLALSVWEVGGLMVVYLAPILASAGGPEVNLAVLAALRTAVLSASSVTLALSSRHKRWPEARWLVYPVLVLVGVKLFLEDFPHGQPLTLFIALALVGSALILVAKLLGGVKPGDQIIQSGKQVDGQL